LAVKKNLEELKSIYTKDVQRDVRRSISDIGLPQCHKCKKNKTPLWKRKKKATCDVMVDQCHQYY